MFALQASIGAVNDLADRSADALAKPHKPLVNGLVGLRAARVVGAAGLVLGLALSAALGVAVVVIALLGVGIGYLYDLRLKGTGWAWLPFALGVPLLPVYAWVGAGAALPSAFAVLLPAAVAAGAALALGNQLDDLADDAVAGTTSTARRLGPDVAWVAMAALYAGVTVAALGSLAVLDGRGAGVVVAGVGAGVTALGTASARLGPQTLRPLRRLAWELQGIGVGILAAGWVAALAETGALAR